MADWELEWLLCPVRWPQDSVVRGWRGQGGLCSPGVTANVTGSMQPHICGSGPHAGKLGPCSCAAHVLGELAEAKVLAGKGSHPFVLWFLLMPSPLNARNASSGMEGSCIEWE